MRDQGTDLAAVLLTLAGTMFMAPMVILLTRLVTGDVPGMMVKTGLWSMAFSLIVASAGVFIGWAEGQNRR